MGHILLDARVQRLFFSASSLLLSWLPLCGLLLQFIMLANQHKIYSRLDSYRRRCLLNTHNPHNLWRSRCPDTLLRDGIMGPSAGQKLLRRTLLWATLDAYSLLLGWKCRLVRPISSSRERDIVNSHPVRHAVKVGGHADLT